MLAAPVALVLEDATGVKRYLGPADGLRFGEKSPDRVVFSGQMALPGLAVKTTATAEYDGQILYRLELTPAGPREVKRLSLEIPLRAVKYFHSSGSGRVPHIYAMDKPATGYVEPAVPIWTPESRSAIPHDRAPAFLLPGGGRGALVERRDQAGRHPRHLLALPVGGQRPVRPRLAGG